MQVPLAGTVAPVSVIVLPRAGAARLLAPPQTDVVPTPVPAVATRICAGAAGRLSTSPVLVTTPLVGLLIMKVNVEVPFGNTGFGLNALITESRPTDSVLLAANALLPAFEVVTAPAPIVLP